MRQLDDIVFKDRNKEYGAYQLRKHYNPTVLWALAFSIFMAFATTFGYYAYYRWGGKKERIIQANLMYDYIQHNPADLYSFTPPPPSDQNMLVAANDEEINLEVVDSVKTERKKSEDKGLQSDSSGTGKLGVVGGTGDGSPFGFAEIMPSFPGGEGALQEFLDVNMIYPLDALRKRIEGTVYVNFVVNTDGEINEIKIVQSVNPQLDKECLRVVKMMPRWTPGRQRGKSVSVLFTLPVRFNLGNFYK
jgi:periplasmic protein TonB